MTNRALIAGALALALIGALWGIERYGYDRGWAAREEEVRVQVKQVEQMDLSTLIRNTAEAKEADRILIDDLEAQLKTQKGIQVRMQAHFTNQPETTNEGNHTFAHCPVDPGTRGMLNDARAAANAAIAASDPEAGDEAGRPAAAGQ